MSGSKDEAVSMAEVLKNISTHSVNIDVLRVFLAYGGLFSTDLLGVFTTREAALAAVEDYARTHANLAAGAASNFVEEREVQT